MTGWFFSSLWEISRAFTYIAKDKSAYLDPAACHMLRCPREKLNEFEFFNLLEKISKNPVEGQKHIYRFTEGGSTKYIKMNIYESSDEWLGFVQDFTRQITDTGEHKSFVEYDPVMRLPSFPPSRRKSKRYSPNVSTAALQPCTSTA